MSASVGVWCAMCGRDLGDQYQPGDGVALFKAHLPECPNNPKLSGDSDE